MKSVTFKVEGMHCDGCAERIARILKGTAGVRLADVAFAEGKARVVYDPGSAGAKVLTAAIERAGYTVARREQ